MQPANESETVFETVELGNGWRVRYELTAAAGGGMAISGLHITPIGKLPEAGITADVLRRLQIGAMRRHANSRNRPIPPAKLARSGRPTLGSTPKLWRAIAKRYQELLRTGVPGIDRKLAGEFKIPYATMRTHIHRARRAGYFNQTVVVAAAAVTLSPKQMRAWRRRHSAQDSAHRR